MITAVLAVGRLPSGTFIVGPFLPVFFEVFFFFWTFLPDFDRFAIWPSGKKRRRGTQ